MKFEFEQDDWPLISAFRDVTSAIVVGRLKEAVKDCAAFDKHPGDRAYNKKFKAAAKLIIEHFGGKD